jgi:4-amino-4-deoxy-L-arabinose transferase-like glycosyltransferase
MASGAMLEAPSIGRTDVATAVLIGCGAFSLFLVTLCPTIYVEDSPEFSTAAAVFGIPHPPGYPLHTLLSALFVRVVPFGDFGFRSNLFSAVCGALTVAVLGILLRRLGIGRAAALAATVCFALGSAFWSQCLAAEVHALNCLLLVLSLLAVFEATRCPAARSFAVSGVAIGLLVGHRNLNVVFVAGLIVLLDVARRRARGGARLLWYFAGAAAATGLIYLYIPLAARSDPYLNMGAPSTLRRFYTIVSARPYFRHFAAGSAAVNLSRLLGYFKNLPTNLGIGTLAAPIGFMAWRRRSGWMPPLAVAWLAASCVVFSSLYNVLDVDSYYLPATLALALLAAFGFDVWPRRLRLVLPIAAIAALPFNLTSVDLHRLNIASVYGRDLLLSAPPRAVVVTFGDTTTHVLWYEQAVLHLRPDLVVVSFDEIDDWYVEQLSNRHPDIEWPAADMEPRWLGTFASRNVDRRPICLTQPLDLGLPGWREGPDGLLSCLRPSLDRPELSRSRDFWRDAVAPRAIDVIRADVHVQMIAFGYSMARFAFARRLAEADDQEGARAQLTLLFPSDPDAIEHAIVTSLTAIGRRQRHEFSLGQKALQALRLTPNDPSLSTLLRP